MRKPRSIPQEMAATGWRAKKSKVNLPLTPALCALVVLTMALGASTNFAQEAVLAKNPVITVPKATVPLFLRLVLPANCPYKVGDIVNLVELSRSSSPSSRGEDITQPLLAWTIPAAAADGRPGGNLLELLAVIPPEQAGDSPQGTQQGDTPQPSTPGNTRRFLLLGASQPERILETPDELAQPPEKSTTGFMFTVDATRLTLWENDRPIFVYNYAPVTASWVPQKDSRRTRACYIHPVFGLDGELLTDDFPRDHYHHHGIFWTWPHIQIDDVEYDLWADRGIRQRFRGWLGLWTGPVAARFAVENGWYVDDRCVMIERVWVTVWPSREEGRFVDFELYFQPQDRPVTLWGAPGKSYGGMTMRFRVREGRPVKITVPAGLTTEDLLETRLRWADLTSQFGDGDAESGATLFVSPDHPDFPPTWLTRHYGPLCVGWPGVEPRTLEPGQTVRLPYRVWIHRGWHPAEEIDKWAAGLTLERQVAWEEPPQPPESPSSSQDHAPPPGG